jgi:tetratricopeptide (TPR) repeat protein
MSRLTVSAAVLLLALAALPFARAAEFQLRAREHDVVEVAGVDKPMEGTILRLNDHLVEFRTLHGIKHAWPRSQVKRIRRKCTLREAYLQAAKAAGDNPRAHLRLHEACLEAGLKKEAVEELRTAIRLDPKYKPAYTKLVAMARAAGDLNLELGALEAAAGADVTAPEWLLRQAEIYVALGLIRNARAPLEQALVLEPLHPRAESRLAMLSLVQGKPGLAETHVRSVLKRRPDDPHALVALGQIELARGHTDKAVQAFQKAAAGGESAAASAALGALALERGDERRAEGRYAQAQALRPDFAPVLAGLGLLAAQEGKADRAAELLGRAAAAAPKRADIAVARGYAAELNGRPQQALQAHDDALRLDKANVHALAGSGRCHLIQGDGDKARSAFEAALALQPDFVPALRGMGRLDQTDRPSRAAELLRRVVRSPAAAPADRVALAGALVRLQRFGEAAAQLHKAGSDHVQARIGLGFLAYAQGRTDEAVEHFEAAVRLGDSRRYAETAIRRIREAEQRAMWSDNFDREPANDPRVRNDWTEMEPPGIAISIADNVLLVDGEPRTLDRMTRLERTEGAEFESIIVEADTGRGAGSLIGLFVSPMTGPAAGQRVLFGRSAEGAAVIAPPRKPPRELGPRVPQGRFTLRLDLVNKKTGRVRLSVNDRPVPGGPIVLASLAGAKGYTVGLFAQPPKGQKVHCRFHAVKIVRSK